MRQRARQQRTIAFCRVATRALARKRHDDNIITVRRAEDAAACAMIGAEQIILHDLDCIYRRDADGSWLYDSEEAIFGPLHPQDDAGSLSAQLENLLERVLPHHVYAPLAIGNHVDHQRARQIAERWVEAGRLVDFYEDYPYVERVDHLWRALNLPTPGVWQRYRQVVSADDVETKIAALACYASQITGLFGDDMPDRVRAQAQRAGNPGLAEILWRLAPAPTEIAAITHLVQTPAS